MKKGILYCVCNKASEEECSNCNKLKKIKPDITINHPLWKKLPLKREIND